MRPVSRGAIFWGAALVSAGLVILALQQDYISADALADVGRYWPLLLIGAGVAIIFAGALGAVATALAGILLGMLVGGLIGGAGSLSLSCGTGDPGALEARDSGEFGSGSPDIVIDLSCADLDVVGASGMEWSVEADDDLSLDITDSSRRLEVTTDETTFIGAEPRHQVRVTVPSDAGAGLDVSVNAAATTFDLAGGAWGRVTVHANAAAVTIDLSDAEGQALEVALNAGSASIQLSEDTRLARAELGANAGAVEVCAPERLGLRITLGNDVAVGHNLEEQGLTQHGDRWETGNYDEADHTIEIQFNGNAASLTLNPEGGCS